MSDQDNLRDKIEEIIEAKTYAMAPDGFIAGTEEAAQAIIDEFGLTMEKDVVFHKVTERGMWEKSEPQTRVVGKWDKQ